MMNILAIILSSIIYAVSINFFIVPAGLYSGGILGLAQVIRTTVEMITNVNFVFDISGMISLFINIPLLLFTRKSNGNKFVVKTLFCIAFQSLLLCLIPVKLIVNNVLTSVIIGGILCGGSIGMLLKYGGSSGGVVIIGVYLTKKTNYSVGKINLFIDIIVYILAFILILDIERIIYTMIFSGICVVALDKTHSQNINCEVIIISKTKYDEIKFMILNRLNRGFSYWKGSGGFTDENNKIIYVITSKYELSQLRQLVQSIDPTAFISVKHNILVYGNFEKRV